MENNKKIYITSLHLRHGGVELVIASLANAFCELGFDVEILCIYNFGEPAYKIDSKVKITYLTDVLPNREAFKAALDGGKFFSVIREGIHAMRVIRLKKTAMRKAIEGINDGIIISTRNEHSVLLSKYGKDGVLKIAQLHHDHKFDRSLLRDFAENYGNIDYFTILTPKLCEEIKGFMKNNTHTVCVNIPNFIEAEEVSSSPIIKKQVIAAGRLHPDKDFHSLLRVWQIVCEECEGYTLKICGEGELSDDLKNYAEELDISDKVEFSGAVEHGLLLGEMSESVCYAMTSVTECFPLVLLETMYCGTPPIAFDLRVGVDAIIEDGKNGIIVKERDEAEMAEKIVELIENSEKREVLSRGAKERAKEFSKENVMKKWLEILK